MERPNGHLAGVLARKTVVKSFVGTCNCLHVSYLLYFRGPSQGCFLTAGGNDVIL